MITAVHALLYSEDPAATRAFFRDVLGWPDLEDTNSEPGWPIFRSGPSEIGVHPNSWTYGGESTTVPIHHEISLRCDDLAATMSELSANGAEFMGEPIDRGFGLRQPSGASGRTDPAVSAKLCAVLRAVARHRLWLAAKPPPCQPRPPYWTSWLL